MTEYDFYVKSDFSQYAGQWIAILNNKVIAHSTNFKQIAEMTDKEVNGKKALIVRIPEKIAQLL